MLCRPQDISNSSVFRFRFPSRHHIIRFYFFVHSLSLILDSYSSTIPFAPTACFVFQFVRTRFSLAFVLFLLLILSRSRLTTGPFVLFSFRSANPRSLSSIQILSLLVRSFHFWLPTNFCFVTRLSTCFSYGAQTLIDCRSHMESYTTVSTAQLSATDRFFFVFGPGKRHSVTLSVLLVMMLFFMHFHVTRDF